MVQFDQSRLADYCQRNSIARLRLFGSAARGDDTLDSDVDLIVDFSVPVGLFEIIRVEGELSSLFGRQVDLLTEPALSPYMREGILADARVIFDGES